MSSPDAVSPAALLSAAAAAAAAAAVSPVPVLLPQAVIPNIAAAITPVIKKRYILFFITFFSFYSTF